jgi:hypothetical protein
VHLQRKVTKTADVPILQNISRTVVIPILQNATRTTAVIAAAIAAAGVLPALLGLLALPV